MLNRFSQAILNYFRHLPILSAALFLFFYSCNKNNSNPAGPEPGPIETVEVSEGNVWQPTAVLPDTGDKIHYVSTHALAVDNDNNIYVGTDFAGAFKSTDDGKTWTTNNTGLIPTDSVYKSYFVSALYSFGNTLFSGSINSMYKSEDQGNNWNISQNWNDYHYVSEFKAKNQRDLYVGTYSGIFKTTDMGKNWINISTNVDWTHLGYAYDLAFTKDGYLLAATINGILETKDDGKTWTVISAPANSTNIEVDDSNNIYISSGTEIYESKDLGKTWQSILKVNSDYSIPCLLVNNKGTIFAGSYEGLYRSQDSGKTFQIVGLENLTPAKIMYDRKGNLIVATFRKGVYISSQ